MLKNSSDKNNNKNKILWRAGLSTSALLFIAVSWSPITRNNAIYLPGEIDKFTIIMPSSVPTHTSP